MFLQELDNFVKTLDDIDDKTPWTGAEPDWWLELSDLRRKIINIKEKVI